MFTHEFDSQELFDRNPSPGRAGAEYSKPPLSPEKSSPVVVMCLNESFYIQTDSALAIPIENWRIALSTLELASSMPMRKLKACRSFLTPVRLATVLIADVFTQIQKLHNRLGDLLGFCADFSQYAWHVEPELLSKRSRFCDRFTFYGKARIEFFFQ